ncbi:MAG: DUF1731 domain-containing protein, partial [Bacteroidales bacterium]
VWTRAPEFVVKLAMGQMATEMLLNGARVLPERLQNQNFHFMFDKPEKALRNLLKKNNISN